MPKGKARPDAQVGDGLEAESARARGRRSEPLERYFDNDNHDDNNSNNASNSNKVISIMQLQMMIIIVLIVIMQPPSQPGLLGIDTDPQWGSPEEREPVPGDGGKREAEAGWNSAGSEMRGRRV